MKITVMLEFVELNCNSQTERITLTKVTKRIHFGIRWTPQKDNVQRYTLQLGIKLSQMRIVLLCICIWNSMVDPKMKAVRVRVDIRCATKLTSQQTKELLASMDTESQIISFCHLVSFWRIDSEKIEN